MNGLGRGAKTALLCLARASVQEAVCRDSSLERALADTRVTEELKEPRGAFVTLKGPSDRASGGLELRGCIGDIAGRAPLYRSVIDVAAKAALEDPRFSPVAADELNGLHVEISALSRLRPVRDPDEIRIGRDGVQLVRNGASAIFLPQVASERSWTVVQTLEHLAVKAGLGADEWSRADLQVFQAEVFSDV